LSIFQDVTMTWKGTDYTVPASGIMRLIAKVEGEISLQQLTQAGGPPLAALSMGYAVALQHAGARGVIAEDVYAALFKTGSAEMVGQAVTSLLMMMMPPESYQPQGDEPKKPQAKAPKKRTGTSSKATR